MSAPIASTMRFAQQHRSGGVEFALQTFVPGIDGGRVDQDMITMPERLGDESLWVCARHCPRYFLGTIPRSLARTCGGAGGQRGTPSCLKLSATSPIQLRLAFPAVRE